MPQFARPTTDVSDGLWTDQSGGSSLFAAIDEPTASNTDYIQSASSPSNDVAEIALSSVVDPQVATGHVVRYRIGKTGTNPIDLTVSLRQGTSTEIASWSHPDVASGPVDVAQTLSAAQANAITNYADLRLRFSASVGALSSGSLDTAIQNSLWWVNHGD